MNHPLDPLPGHLIRRVQQIAVAHFLDETSDFGITPVQYGAMAAVQANPDIDQRSLADLIAFDTSTIGGVVDRLEARGWMQRNASPTDRRVRLLTLTREGEATLQRVRPAMLRAQTRILAPLSEREQSVLLKLLGKIVAADCVLDEPSDAAA
jgi:MarR family transcriptional regulator, lower aerobic nicotinate degradation pathway regulator